MLHPLFQAAEGHKSSPAAALNFNGYYLSHTRVVSSRGRMQPRLVKSAFAMDSAI